MLIRTRSFPGECGWHAFSSRSRRSKNQASYWIETGLLSREKRVVFEHFFAGGAMQWYTAEPSWNAKPCYYDQVASQEQPSTPPTWRVPFAPLDASKKHCQAFCPFNVVSALHTAKTTSQSCSFLRLSVPTALAWYPTSCSTPFVPSYCVEFGPGQSDTDTSRYIVVRPSEKGLQIGLHTR